MKKVLVVFLLIALLVSLCACSVPANSFMSKSMVNSLSKKIGEPKAVVTLTYTSGKDEYVVKITYKLLFEQAPIAVTRFIQIATKDANSYDNTIIDTLESTNKSYMIMGRYEKREDSGSTKYYNLRTTDNTFAGEFKSNDYSQPKDGYADFKVLSLAMFHEADGDHFNSANGTIIMALGNKITLNSANYAVFAEFESMDVIVNNGEPQPHTKVDSTVLSYLKGLASRTTHPVYDASNESAGSTSVSMISNPPTLSVKILGDYDWTKLPTIR